VTANAKSAAANAKFADRTKAAAAAAVPAALLWHCPPQLLRHLQAANAKSAAVNAKSADRSHRTKPVDAAKAKAADDANARPAAAAAVHVLGECVCADREAGLAGVCCREMASLLMRACDAEWGGRTNAVTLKQKH
jgi:hypothetical protein